MHIAEVLVAQQVRAVDPAAVDTVAQAERKLDNGDGAGLDVGRIENQNAGQARIAPVGDRDEEAIALGSYPLGQY